MRKVQVYKNTVSEMGHSFKEEHYKGVFHSFSTDYQEFKNGPGQFPVALIEKEDGFLKSVPVELVQFLEELSLESPKGMMHASSSKDKKLNRLTPGDKVRVVVKSEYEELYFPKYLHHQVGIIWQIDDEHVYIKSSKQTIPTGNMVTTGPHRYVLSDVNIYIIEHDE